MEPTGRSSTVTANAVSGFAPRANAMNPRASSTGVRMGKPIPHLQPHLAVVGVAGQLGGVRLAERPHAARFQIELHLHYLRMGLSTYGVTVSGCPTSRRSTVRSFKPSCWA